MLLPGKKVPKLLKPLVQWTFHYGGNQFYTSQETPGIVFAHTHDHKRAQAHHTLAHPPSVPQSWMVQVWRELPLNYSQAKEKKQERDSCQ